MTTRVQHRRSSVAGNIPGPSDLQVGEIGINFADRQLFTKNGSNAVIRVNGNLALTQPVANEQAGDAYIDVETGKLYAYFSLDGDPIDWNEVSPETDVSGFLELTGGTMTGPIVVFGTASGNQAIGFTQVGNMIADSVDDYLPLLGGTLTGPLILSADPLVDLGAATKQYVDDAIDGIGAPDLTGYLQKTGGTMTGQITLPGGGVNNQAVSANELAAAIAAHVALPDPHDQYATVVEAQIDVISQASGVGGTADAIALTFSPALAAYTNRMRIRWVSPGPNTVTNPTVNIGGAGAKTIKKREGVALQTGDTGASGYVCDAVYNGTDFILMNPASYPTEQFPVAVSDEITNLTTGTAKVTWHWPYAAEILEVFAGLSSVQTGGSVLTVDVNKNGSTMMTTNKLVWDNNEETTLTYSGTAAALTTTTVAKGDKGTIDIDQVGTASAKGLKVYFILRRLP